MKPINTIFICSIMIVMLFTAGSAQAFVIRRGNDVTVPKGETINETLVAFGQNVIVDGDVNGDIICAGQNVTINGSVAGDILCAAQSLLVANSVQGSVRAVGQSVQIKGSVARNVTVAGQTIIQEAPIAGEMLFAAQRASINGQIAKDVAGAGNNITVSGSIGGNAQFADSDLVIQKGASVGGSLNYTSANAATIDSGAHVAGSVTRTEPPQKNVANVGLPQKSAQDVYLEKIGELLLYLVVALILVFFFAKPVTKAVGAMLSKPQAAAGWGLLLLAVAPVACVATFLTIIGIPLALIAALLFAIALFFSRIFAAIAVGRKFAQTYMKKRPDSLYLQAVIGVVVSWIIFAIPFVGWIFSAAAVIWGMGGIYYLFKKLPVA